jgi:Cu/Ag efflux pump CusA
MSLWRSARYSGATARVRSTESSLLQEQDRIIRTFPEVETVFGTIGRSDSATDNAPLNMYDTTIMLKPREQWRPGMTYEPDDLPKN